MRKRLLKKVAATSRHLLSPYTIEGQHVVIPNYKFTTNVGSSHDLYKYGYVDKNNRPVPGIKIIDYTTDITNKKYEGAYAVYRHVPGYNPSIEERDQMLKYKIQSYELDRRMFMSYTTTTIEPKLVIKDTQA